jgi:SNF2 family DNA or RNA helicase
VVSTLVAEGWRVEAEGRLYRAAGTFDIEVRSGIDWFEVRGQGRFGEQSVALPRLLEALEEGQPTVLLDDGTVGMLPEAWLRTLSPLEAMSESHNDGLRLRRNQVGILDALLALQPETRFDQTVARMRKNLAQFSGIHPRTPPRTFKATLRDYQKEGLGWLHFLQGMGFGGCLADDMGLGKTVQVLALLESRRQARHRKGRPAAEGPGPSLVVVPRSLVFNWHHEAERFTPKIRVLDYSGPKRRENRDHFGDYDVILTTYGTLRRDIVDLQEYAFDYVVLDEAQAIKNHKSATAKACRLLRGQHRLALTGTPVENHAGELMSILDFLNPGIFGPQRKLEVPRLPPLDAVDGEGALHPKLAFIASAVRPFILRRTKGQVARDLPEKVEQTVYCDLLPKQRKEYDQLRRHYQRELLGKVEEQGLARSKMHVLEALLRLRQAACHPGLIDPQRRDDDSGKLALLLTHLEEILEGGHKVLVFSQFTSLLAIVRSRLDTRGIPYEYLDGRTRKRQPKIERFQEDPSCPIFLISLKAGGVGLNLTAAGYVFLLDPWWNPAVEAQAIDRTHRIGQTRSVFAYSLIARDTVEEKVLALQRSKRELADAIVRADSSLLRTLTREDLAELLS